MSVWTRQTILRRAHEADIPAIMEIERQPGFERLVGRWDKAQHLHNISRPGFLYLVRDGQDGIPVAFAALSGFGDTSGDVLLNRIIVRSPGQGIGSVFLDALMGTVFDGSPARRFWLRVLPDNQRAQNLYRSRGFKDEGRVPLAGMRPDGVRVDLLVMSVDYEDWDARRP